MQTSRLTLAVIVKNEAALLDGLLRHHFKLYDEAVVVDTGSSDGSAEIAANAGARVFHHQWNDDFAAARNLGLDAVATPWVLQLDCDERINPKDFASIRAKVAQAPEFCFELPINNYTATTKGGEWYQVQSEDSPWCENALGYVRTYPVRLFPNLPNLRFNGVIHENLKDGISQSGLPINRSEEIIHHTGLLQPDSFKRRDPLYARLLEKKVQLDPHDLNGLTEYGKLLLSRGELEKAEKMMESGLSSEISMGENALANLLMVEILARSGKVEVALERLNKTIHRHPTHLLCWIQAAALNIATGQTQKARIYLEQGIKLFPNSAVLKELEAKV